MAKLLRVCAVSTGLAITSMPALLVAVMAAIRRESSHLVVFLLVGGGS